MTLIEKLNKIVEGGTKVSEIERRVNYPKNQLSAVLRGHKKLPKKWEDILGALVTENEFLKSITIELPADFISVDKVAIITKEGKIEPLATPVPDWAKDYVMALDEFKPKYFEGVWPTVQKNSLPEYTHPTAKEASKFFHEQEKAPILAKIQMLEKELAAIPDKNNGFGKQLAASVEKRIKNLKNQL